MKNEVDRNWKEATDHGLIETIPAFVGGIEENHESLSKGCVLESNRAFLEYVSRPLALRQSTQFACSVNNGYVNEYGEEWQMQTRKNSFEKKK
jgi:hypothetical protein